jgi:PHD/YefM family antitoxin component YafN of YafNO toxin-antitoxin module
VDSDATTSRRVEPSKSIRPQFRWAATTEDRVQTWPPREIDGAQPKRIPEVDRIALGESVEIEPAREPERIFLREGTILPPTWASGEPRPGTRGSAAGGGRSLTSDGGPSPLSWLTSPARYCTILLYNTQRAIMAITTTYSTARHRLAEFWRRVEENREAAHLLRSPANARRLLQAIERALEGGGEPRPLDDLKHEFGLDPEEG